MAEIRRSDDLRVAQAVLEVRYPNAHKYWDECGALIAMIESKIPGLRAQRLDQKGFEFAGSDSVGVSKATFYWNRVEVVQGPGNAQSRFIELAATFWRLVASSLHVEHILRLGHRVWSYVELPNTAAANEFLESRDIWELKPALQGFGKPMNHGLVLRSRLQNGRELRLECDAATLKFMGPGGASVDATGVIFDLDFTSASANDDAAELQRFMQGNYRFAKENVSKIVEGRR